MALLACLAAAPAVSAQTTNLAPTVVAAQPNGGERLSSVPEPEGHGAPFLIVYAATDPDGDPVTVRVLAVQQAGAVGAPPLTGPIVIAEGLPPTGTLLWDTRMIPDGAGYRIRVEATDNGEGGVRGSGGVPLTGADETDGRFLVDNTPPTASLEVIESDYLALDPLALTATAGDLPFFPPEGVVRPHARPLHITLTLDPGDPGERALEVGDTLDLATVAPGRHRLRLRVRDQSGLVANDVRVIHVLTAAEGFALVQERLEALQADSTCAPGALPALAEAHALLAAALQRQRPGNVQGFVQKLAESAGQLQLAGAAEPRTGALAETLALLVRDLLRPRVEYLETTRGFADPQVTPIRSFFAAGVALLAGGNFSGAILEFKKAQNRINALDTQSPEITRLAPSERFLQTGEFTVRYGFSDFLTDIAPTSVLLEVDGVDRTAEAAHSDQRLRIEFAGATALPEGDHEFRLTVVDVQGNPATRADRIWVDLAAPTAAWTSPAAGWVTSNRPLARIEYADAAPGCGIDPAEDVQILLDGAEVTSEALRGEDFATHQAPFGSELTEGTHVYSATVLDRSGRSVTTERAFAVDSIPPAVTIVSPVDGSSTAVYVLDYRALASDANVVALVSATINDHDATEQFATEPDGFLWHPVSGDPVFLHLGENVFRVTVADPAGNAMTREIGFTLTAGPGGGEPPPTVPGTTVLRIVSAPSLGAIGRCAHNEDPDGTATGPIPFVVELVNESDETPVPGALMAFTTSSDSGFFVADRELSTVTDATGRAGVRYLLGRSPTAPAHQILTARVQADPSVPAVSHEVVAHLPELTAKTRIYRLPYVLQDTAEWTIETSVTYDGGRYPLPQTPVELTFEHDGAIVAPAEDLLLLGPEFSRQTAADGVVWTTVVPRQPGTWKASARLPEFPELAASPISVYLSGVPVADSIGVLLRGDSSGLGLPSYLMGTILNTPTTPGTAASGRVAAAGHPLTFEVAPPPVPPIFNTWFKATYGTALSSWKVRLRSVGADPVTLSSPELTISSPDGTATFTAEPTGNRTSLIEVELWGLDATGRYERLMWTERAGMFAPEVRLVEADGAGGFREPRFLVPYDPFADQPRPRREYFVEARMPLDEPNPARGGSESADICRESTPEIPGSIGMAATESLTLPRVSEGARFALYRSPSSSPLVYLTRTLRPGETGPRLPPGAIYLQGVARGWVTAFAFSDDKEPTQKQLDPKAFNGGEDDQTLTADGFDPNSNNDDEADDPILMASDLDVRRDDGTRVDSQVTVHFDQEPKAPITFVAEKGKFEVVSHVDPFAGMEGFQNKRFLVTIRGHSLLQDEDDNLVIKDADGQIGHLAVRVWKTRTANVRLLKLTNATGGSRRDDDDSIPTRAVLRTTASLIFRQCGIRFEFSDATAEAPSEAFEGAEFIPRTKQAAIASFLASNAPSDAILVVLCEDNGDTEDPTPAFTQIAYDAGTPLLTKNFVVLDDKGTEEALGHELGHHIGNMFKPPLSHGGDVRSIVGLLKRDPKNFQLVFISDPRTGDVLVRAGLHMFLAQATRMRARFLVTTRAADYATGARVLWDLDPGRVYAVLASDADGSFDIVREDDASVIRRGIPPSQLSPAP